MEMMMLKVTKSLSNSITNINIREVKKDKKKVCHIDVPWKEWK